MATTQSGGHVPAWRQLGLKLKTSQQTIEVAKPVQSLDVSSKRSRSHPIGDRSGKATAQESPKDNKVHAMNKDSTKVPRPLKRQLDMSRPQPEEESKSKRRKSVTFSENTKRIDGKPSDLTFTDWVDEHVTAKSEIDSPKREENGKQAAKKSRKSSKVADNKNSETSAAYMQYLEEHQNSRDDWKFNKAKQISLLKHAFDVDRIPTSHTDALSGYVKGLRGESARDRLKETAKEILSKANNANQEAEDVEADEPEGLQGQALRKRLQQNKERDRKAEREDSKQSEDFQMLIKQRSRAEAILKALASSEPTQSTQPVSSQPKPAPGPTRLKFDDEDEDSFQRALDTKGKKVKVQKRQKTQLRTGVPDDDDSSSVSDVSSNFSWTTSKTALSTTQSNSGYESDPQNSSSTSETLSNDSIDAIFDSDSEPSTAPTSSISGDSPMRPPEYPASSAIAGRYTTEVMHRLQRSNIVKSQASTTSPNPTRRTARPVNLVQSQSSSLRHSASPSPTGQYTSEREQRSVRSSSVCSGRQSSPFSLFPTDNSRRARSHPPIAYNQLPTNSTYRMSTNHTNRSSMYASSVYSTPRRSLLSAHIFSGSISNGDRSGSSRLGYSASTGSRHSSNTGRNRGYSYSSLLGVNRSTSSRSSSSRFGR